MKTTSLNSAKDFVVREESEKSLQLPSLWVLWDAPVDSRVDFVGNIQIFSLEPLVVRRVGCAIGPFFRENRSGQASLSRWRSLRERSSPMNRRAIPQSPYKAADYTVSISRRIYWRNWCLRWSLLPLSLSFSFTLPTIPAGVYEQAGALSSLFCRFNCVCGERRRLTRV